MPSPNVARWVPISRLTGNTRANGILTPTPSPKPSARNSAVSCRLAAPAWLATISPSMASALARTPARSAAGRVSKMSALTMNREISEAVTPLIWVSNRQTSRAIDAPDPPAMEPMTSTMVGFCSSYSLPSAYAAFFIEVVVSLELIRSIAALSWVRTSPALASRIIRPTARYWPAPTLIGRFTVSGRRGAQVAMVSKAFFSPSFSPTVWSRSRYEPLFGPIPT